MNEYVKECFEDGYFAQIYNMSPTVNGVMLVLPNNILSGAINVQIAYIIDKKNIICKATNNDFETFEEKHIQYKYDWEIRPLVINAIRKAVKSIGLDPVLVLPINSDGEVVDILTMMKEPKDLELEKDFLKELYLKYIGENENEM